MNQDIIKQQQAEWDKKWSKISDPIAETEYAREVYQYLEDKKCHTLLDLGCGDGRDSFFFAQNKYAVTAVDFSSVSLHLLKKRLEDSPTSNLKYINSNIAELDLKNESFDVIFANLSLHYFDDKTTSAIFDNLYSILNKDGYLFVRCKSTDDFLYGKGEKLEDNVYVKGGKVRHFFDTDYLQNKLSKFNLLEINTEESEHLMMDKNVVISSFVKAIAQKSH